MDTATQPSMVIPNNCTILAIRNRHRQPAPDLQPIAGTDCYVSYFENAAANQWIFVRPHGAGQATLYGSTLNWAPCEVSGQLPADLALDDHERAWLDNAWRTSEARQA